MSFLPETRVSDLVITRDGLSKLLFYFLIRSVIDSCSSSHGILGRAWSSVPNSPKLDWSWKLFRRLLVRSILLWFSEKRSSSPAWLSFPHGFLQLTIG